MRNLKRIPRVLRNNVYSNESNDEQLEKRIVDSFDNMVNLLVGNTNKTSSDAIEDDFDDNGDDTPDSEDNSLEDGFDGSDSNDVSTQEETSDEMSNGDDVTNEESEIEESEISHEEETETDNGDTNETIIDSDETEEDTNGNQAGDEEVTVNVEELNQKLDDLIKRDKEVDEVDEEIDEVTDQLDDEAERGTVSNETINRFITLQHRLDKLTLDYKTESNTTNMSFSLENYKTLTGCERLFDTDKLKRFTGMKRTSNKEQVSFIKQNIEKVIWDIIYGILNTIDITGGHWKALERKLAGLKDKTLALNPPINVELYSRITATDTLGHHETDLTNFASRVNLYADQTLTLVEAIKSKELRFSDFVGSIDTDDLEYKNPILERAREEYNKKLEQLLGKGSRNISDFYFCGAVVNNEGGISIRYLTSNQIRHGVGYELLGYSDLKQLIEDGININKIIKSIRIRFGALCKTRVQLNAEVEKTIREMYGLNNNRSYTGDVVDAKNFDEFIDRVDSLGLGINDADKAARKALAKQLIKTKQDDVRKDFNSIKSMLKAISNGNNALLYFAKMYLR